MDFSSLIFVLTGIIKRETSLLEKNEEILNKLSLFNQIYFFLSNPKNYPSGKDDFFEVFPPKSLNGRVDSLPTGKKYFYPFSPTNLVE
jgi:hypothetical protein